MGNEVITTMAAIATAIIGLAVLSVIVSRNAQTPQVIQSLAAGLGGDIAAATAPVTGGGLSLGGGGLSMGGGLGGMGGYGMSGY